MKIKSLKRTISLIAMTMMITLGVQTKLPLAEESGVMLTMKNGKKEVIQSAGIASPSMYSQNKKSITFTYNYNFIWNTSSNATDTVFEVEPDLAPYVDHIEVVKNMGHGTTPNGSFVVLENSPGVYTFKTEDALQTHACSYTHTAQMSIILKCPVDMLPRDKYVYSLKLVDPKQKNQYILKSRVQGIIEKNPTEYSTLDYGVFKSMLGFQVGRPLESDSALRLRYAVSYRKASLKYTNYEFHFDPCLVEYIDYVEFYHASKHKLVSRINMPGSGKISIPGRSVYPIISLFNAYPIDFKVYLKAGYTVGDLPCGAYKITALSTYSLSKGDAIHKNSVCTLGFNTHPYNCRCQD